MMVLRHLRAFRSLTSVRPRALGTTHKIVSSPEQLFSMLNSSVHLYRCRRSPALREGLRTEPGIFRNP